MTRYGGRSADSFRYAAMRAGRKADHTSPLRKVIGPAVIERDGLTFQRLLLECGHKASYPQTAWGGDYTPVRRRCRDCRPTREEQP